MSWRRRSSVSRDPPYRVEGLQFVEHVDHDARGDPDRPGQLQLAERPAPQQFEHRAVPGPQPQRRQPGREQGRVAGTNTVLDNLADAAVALFGQSAITISSLVVSRPDVAQRLLE
ncbi:MAG: hypothetical protein JWN00_3158, partial [Actinomycetia bacterium]|nr:hypothetical protein [Actinomycetes bacterium]